MLAILTAICSVLSCVGAKVDTAGLIRELAPDPLNATYMIEDRKIPLVNGRCEMEAAPNAATKIRTAVFGQMVYGDIDGEGGADAALFLTHDSGGSGTFYYIAAALDAGGGFRGTNAVLIGDRIAPNTIGVRSGMVVVNYADRRPEEPLSVSPSVDRSKYLILKNDQLTEVLPRGEGEHVLEGWVTIGHEVRSLAPCSRKRELWLLGNSPALKDVMTAYREVLPSPEPYTPLFMIVSGKFADPPTDGFGAEYQGAFFIRQLIRVSPKGNCRGGLIYLDSPLSGALVTSPLKVRGYARGTWFFEGDFPMVLVDSEGKVMTKGFCSAKNHWMTENFVRFEGSIEFKKTGAGDRGTLILKKDNPTDLPEYDDALEVTIFFE
jgi:hypothetical protein